MDKKNDFFQKKLSNTRSFSRQKKKSNYWWIVLVLLLFFVVGFFIWQIFLQSTGVDNVEDVTRYSIGEQLYLQGDIKSNGDIVTYTHTLQEENGGFFGLKSTELNLFDYNGFVELTGIIEKYNKEIPILRVMQLSGNVLSGDSDVDISLDEQKGTYIMSAGMYFLPTFFDDYFLLNDGENGEVKIQNIESGDDIVLNYFRCNPLDPNRDCAGLRDTFANSAVHSFVTSEGDNYYKLSEVQSWYVSNGNWWGIFLNDVADDIVYDLKDKIKFANEKNVGEWMKSRAVSLCKGSGEEMQKITESEIILKQEGLIAVVSGDGKEKRMTCQILIDFGLPEKGKVQSLTVGDELIKSDDSSDLKIEEIDNNIGEIEEDKNQGEVLVGYGERDSNVEQFPIKPEGGLIYNSARGGYSLQFPSSNISFAASAVKENLGQSDLSCSYVVNVIKYSDKENLEISPAIRVYECSAKSDIASWTQEYVIKKMGDKLFVIQINDSSWIDFVNNLKFSEFE